MFDASFRINRRWWENEILSLRFRFPEVALSDMRLVLMGFILKSKLRAFERVNSANLDPEYLESDNLQIQ